MKIALLGYGKMGKAIEKIALERGHEIVLRVNSTQQIDPYELKNANLAFEFSRPDTAAKHINICFDLGIPVVVGTTGWQEDMLFIKNRCLLRTIKIFLCRFSFISTVSFL